MDNTNILRLTVDSYSCCMNVPNNDDVDDDDNNIIIIIIITSFSQHYMVSCS